MEYMSITQAAEKWGITQRRIQVLCKEERIPGAIRIGYVWAIPADAEKPKDARVRSGKYVKATQGKKDGVAKSGITPLVVQQICDLAKQHDVKKVILFGSRARGTFQRTSDIDLALQGGNISQFRVDVEEETHTLLTFDVVNLASDLSPELKKAINTEGVLLYEEV